MCLCTMVQVGSWKHLHFNVYKYLPLMRLKTIMSCDCHRSCDMSCDGGIYQITICERNVKNFGKKTISHLLV